MPTNVRNGWKAAIRLCSYPVMKEQHLIPLGYMLKTVASPPPEWLEAPAVKAVHSLSGCVSADFGDYIPIWKHNGWWLFDTPKAVYDAAEELKVETDGLTLFYYEAFDQQYDEKSKAWQPFEPETGGSFTEGVVRPDSATLSGYDVVSFFVQTSPECSPLSCNSLAATLRVNERCLFDSFDQAFAALENGEFEDTEPGPYRIIAVYLVETVNRPAG